MKTAAVLKPQTPETSPEVEALCRAFIDRKAKIGIIGLGYVGLPLACAICDKGFQAVGFDIDTKKIDRLRKGESYIGNIHNDKISAFVEGKAFIPTTNFDALSTVDAIIMCVPTPLNKNREPDMTYIVKTTETVAQHLIKNQLVILESTTYPGTTRGIVKNILEEKSGLKSGVDFYLAFSPEREDPGNPHYHTASIPKVVGGDGRDAQLLALTMYEQFLDKTVPVSSPEVAEAVKLTENIFRCINIALVNELKVVYDAMGIDIWEVIEAAKTKPFGYMPFYPGPGLGGHCIPIDPYYLSWKAREHNVTARFIELAGEINVAMPNYVVSRLSEAMDQRLAKSLNGAKILLLGVAYKKNVADDRESPAYEIMELLKKRGAIINFHDPHVAVTPNKRNHPELSNLPSVILSPGLIKDQDAVVIVTDHDDVDYGMIAKHAKLVVDTRNAMADIENRGNIVKA